MGTIIGEGITFDDVLLVPAYSKVIPNQVDGKTEHSYDERRNGYSYRAQDGDRYGQTGRYRYYSQEYVHRGTGRRGRQGKTF